MAGIRRIPRFAVAVAAVLAGCTLRVSVDQGGGDADRASRAPAVSADGRWVAFVSPATDLVPGDGNGLDDVFARDLATGTTLRVSVDAAGGDPDGASGSPAISADGRYVAFESAAPDLVAGDTNGAADVFVRDLQSGITVRASVNSAGGSPNGASHAPGISGDGRFVVFHSSASNFLAGDTNGFPDVYVRVLDTGRTYLVSRNTGFLPANGGSYDPVVSDDGRWVAFWSLASDLVSGDTNGAADVFLRDRTAGTTLRMSVDRNGFNGDDASTHPAISADGARVAFQSFASDLVDGDGNGESDVFVRDVPGATTTRVSVDRSGGDADSASSGAAISRDGAWVAFESAASDLTGGDEAETLDVFVRAAAGGPAERVSVDALFGNADGPSDTPSVADGGDPVVFRSDATDVASADTNGIGDVFVRVRNPS